MARTPQGHLNALNSRLGKAARIGGVAYVERAATSDEFAATFLALDAAGRKKALATVARVLEKTRATPPKKMAPSPDERVKVRWTDQLIARFKREAPWCRDNMALAVKLGLPDYCEGAMRAARSRYLPRAAATQKAPTMRQIHALTPVLREAA